MRTGAQLFFLFFFLASCTSCSSSDSGNNTDSDFDNDVIIDTYKTDPDAVEPDEHVISEIDDCKFQLNYTIDSNTISVEKYNSFS